MAERRAWRLQLPAKGRESWILRGLFAVVVLPLAAQSPQTAGAIDRDERAGCPILVGADPGNPFTIYYAETLQFRGACAVAAGANDAAGNDATEDDEERRGPD